MKLYLNPKQYFLILTLLFLSCEKVNTIDKRDKYVGRYSGIEIYKDYQNGTRDTSNINIYLKKYDQDTVSAIELNLPSASQIYLYDVIKDSLVFHGSNFHSPILTIRRDTLICNWAPGLAPRSYKYIAIKD